MNESERAGPIVWTGIIAVTCVLLLVVNKLLWLALPFIFGTVLHYILLGPMQRMVRAGYGRNAAAMWVCLLFFSLASLALAAILSWSHGPEEDSWEKTIGLYLDGGVAFVHNTMTLLEARFPVLAEMRLTSTVNKAFRTYTDNFAQEHLGEILVGVATWVPLMLLVPFLTFFFLRDGLRFKKFLARAVPNAYFERSLYLLHEVDQTARRYFEGLLKLTVLDTAVLALGLYTIGVSSPLLLGLISAVLAWVPFVGSVAGCVLVVIVASTDAPNNPLVAYGAIGVFVLVRLLDDFVFMPLTLGRSLRVHPLVTVLMIFVGGALAGVVGLMLVLPLLGVVMVIGETLGRLVTNPRLRARHRYARALRTRQASVDLDIARERRGAPTPNAK
ncbi:MULTISPECIES: AI-2E family transporter [unclassified Massilia]|uniref:AI-2E family transporter n=1 Tax=unclassified Massilia TaxID=2609279 RepID=UPI001B81D1AE|nr:MULTISPECIES: AI-2E family transporter [unclassified Massilia]MBQ5940972.1 AI-2E family transporter [Massilia sp. AB1]MBQ5963762.1 AI-2E family transporter [Massilia sp. ZL223]